MQDYFQLLLGILFAGIGGELFVRGSVALARWIRISPGIVGATVAAFSTSSPELAVSISAASSGQPQISLGDVLGSNIVNISLLLGLALCFSGISCPRDTVRRELPFAILAPILTLVMLLDGILSRMDALGLLILFGAWLILTVNEARKQRSAAAEVLGTPHPGRIFLLNAVGLGLLVAAGILIVGGARGIAHSFGISEFLIGATVVALGTSAPELATILLAKLRGHDEVGLGTVLGSNIFNGLFIVGVAALICPISVPLNSVLVALIFGVLSLIASFPRSTGYLSRRRGVILLCLYVIYVLVIFQLQANGSS